MTEDEMYANNNFMAGRKFQNDICTPKLNHYKNCIAALIRISEIERDNRFHYRISGTPFTAIDYHRALTECAGIAKEVLKEQP